MKVQLIVFWSFSSLQCALYVGCIQQLHNSRGIYYNHGVHRLGESVCFDLVMCLCLPVSRHLSMVCWHKIPHSVHVHFPCLYIRIFPVLSTHVFVVYGYICICMVCVCVCMCVCVCVCVYVCVCVCVCVCVVHTRRDSVDEYRKIQYTYICT